MANVIDNRLVNMRMDTSEFTPPAIEATTALDKLKLALSKLPGGIDVGGISDGVVEVADKFSFLEQMAIGAMRRIGEMAANFGISIARQITIDPLRTGWQEYELKMNNVQTIMNGTGESLETVMKYLEELNSYADDTIYSFQDMTANIGKFTNAGVKLETAVNAIKGMSNLAAISGASTAENSRAMYNVAQALSTGSMKLIDWKSIENANMATLEFKQTLIDTAKEMGVLQKANIGSKLKWDEVTAKNFRASIEGTQGLTWVTNEVLIKALEKYSDKTTEFGQKAYDAATSIKTLTQLLDVMREAAQSGWAQTWELLIGDFEKSKKVWTAVGDEFTKIIDDMADKRNLIFKTLNTGSYDGVNGREGILGGIANVYNNIKTIITAILEEVRKVFPALRGSQVLKLAAQFYKLTESLKPSAKFLQEVRDLAKWTAEALKKLKIDAWVKFGNVIKESASVMKNDFARAFTAVHDILGSFFGTLQQTNAVATVFERTAKAIVKVVDILADLLTQIARDVEGTSFWMNSLNVISDILKSIVRLALNLWAIFTGKEPAEFAVTLANINKGIDNFKKKLVEFITKLPYSSIAGFFSTIGKLFKEGWSNVKAVFTENEEGETHISLLDVLFDSLQKIWDKITNWVKGKKNDIDKLFETLAQEIKDSDAMNLGNLLIGGGFIALLTKSWDVIKGFFSFFKDGFKSEGNGLGKSIGAIAQALDTLEDLALNITTEAIENIAKAILMLAVSMAILASLNATDLLATTGVVSLLLKEITSLSIMDTKGMTQKDALGLAALVWSLESIALAVLVLAVAVKLLASTDLWSLAKGMFAVSGLFWQLIAAISILEAGMTVDKGKGIKAAAKGMISLAIAIVILAAAVKLLGSTDLWSLIKGLAGVMGLMFAVYLFTKSLVNEMSDLDVGAGGMLALGAYLISIGIAMVILGAACKMLGEMKLLDLVQGGIALAAIMGMIVGFTALMNNLKISPADIMALAGYLLILSASIMIITLAVVALAALPLEKAIQGVVAMAALLFMIETFTSTMANNVSPGEMAAIAGSLVLMGIALVLFSTAITMMALVPWQGVLTAVLAMAAIMAIILIAANFAEALAPGLLALAATFLAVGAAAFLIGAGLLLAAMALTAFIQAFRMIRDLLKEGAEGILETVHVVGQTIVAIIKDVVVGLLEAANEILPQLIDFLTTLWSSMLDTAIQIMPKIISFVILLITGIITAARVLIPQLIALLDETLTAILAFIVDMTPKIVESVLLVLAGIIDGLAAGVDDLAKAWINLVVASIDAINWALEEGWPKIKAALLRLWETIKGLATEKFGKAFTKIKEFAKELLTKFKDGVVADLKIVSDAMEEIWNKIRDFFAGIKDKFMEIGKNIVDGIVGGIKKHKDEAGKAGEELGNTVKSGTQSSVDSHSPAKEFIKIGKFIDQGLAIGIRRYQRFAGDAAYDAGLSTLDTMEDVFAAVSSIFDDQMTDPVIRPVMDLSEIQNGADEISKMFWNRDARVSMNSMLHAKAAVNARAMSDINGGGGGDVTYNFNQNNYSPKALNRTEIYRQTRNQFAMMKGAVAR